MGPRTEPCGTPDCTATEHKDSLSNTTDCVRSVDASIYTILSRFVAKEKMSCFIKSLREVHDENVHLLDFFLET